MTAHRRRPLRTPTENWRLKNLRFRRLIYRQRLGSLGIRETHTPAKPRSTRHHQLWRTQAPPAPSSRAPRTPARDYRPLHLARTSVPTELNSSMSWISSRRCWGKCGDEQRLRAKQSCIRKCFCFGYLALATLTSEK